MENSQLSQLLVQNRAIIESLEQSQKDTLFSQFSACLQSDSYYFLSSEGLQTSLHENGEFEISLGKSVFRACPKEVRQAELKKERSEAEAKLNAFKLRQADIISHAGDLPRELVDSLKEILRFLVRAKSSGVFSASMDSSFAAVQQLAKVNGMSIHLEPQRPGTAKGGFSMEIAKIDEEEINLKAEVELYLQLLKFYEHLYVVFAEGTSTFKYCRRAAELGTPILAIEPHFTFTGFLQHTGEGYVIERLHKTYLDGCVFDGKVVDGVEIGSGSFLMVTGSKFMGTVKDKNSAEGEIITGNQRHIGGFKITTNGNTRMFTPIGNTEIYQNRRLIKQGFTHDDGSFRGWIIVGLVKVTGFWDSSEELTEGKIENQGQVIQGTFRGGKMHGNCSVCSQEFSFSGQYESGLRHGQGRHVQGNLTIDGNWTRGDLTYGTLKAPGETYTGSFHEGKPHGQGFLTAGNQRYNGEFQQGRLHGKGVLIIGNTTIDGNFVQGVHQGYCKITCPDFTYEGDCWNGQSHGNGFLRTKEFSYRGTFLNGQPDGQGTITKNNVACSEASANDQHVRLCTLI